MTKSPEMKDTSNSSKRVLIHEGSMFAKNGLYNKLRAQQLKRQAIKQRKMDIISQNLMQKQSQEKLKREQMKEQIASRKNESSANLRKKLNESLTVKKKGVVNLLHKRKVSIKSIEQQTPERESFRSASRRNSKSRERNTDHSNEEKETRMPSPN